MKVLVVEDDVDLRALCQEVLEEEGHQVLSYEVVPSEKQVNAYKPDVVLSDIKVPGDGFTLADLLIKKNHPPIVFMTAFQVPIDLQRHGAVGVIRKPFTYEELLGMVESAAQVGYMGPLRLQGNAP